jgi:hypothetical protein
MTDLPFTEAQARQLTILRGRGYLLRIVHRNEDILRLGVAGRDPSNARVVGAIDARGEFQGELLDHRPSKVAVGAPPAEALPEEAVS